MPKVRKTTIIIEEHIGEDKNTTVFVNGDEAKKVSNSTAKEKVSNTSKAENNTKTNGSKNAKKSNVNKNNSKTSSNSSTSKKSTKSIKNTAKSTSKKKTSSKTKTNTKSKNTSKSNQTNSTKAKNEKVNTSSKTEEVKKDESLILATQETTMPVLESNQDKEGVKEANSEKEIKTNEENNNDTKQEKNSNKNIVSIIESESKEETNDNSSLSLTSTSLNLSTKENKEDNKETIDNPEIVDPKKEETDDKEDKETKKDDFILEGEIVDKDKEVKSSNAYTEEAKESEDKVNTKEEISTNDQTKYVFVPSSNEESEKINNEDEATKDSNKEDIKSDESNNEATSSTATSSNETTYTTVPKEENLPVKENTKVSKSSLLAFFDDSKSKYLKIGALLLLVILVVLIPLLVYFNEYQKSKDNSFQEISPEEIIKDDFYKSFEEFFSDLNEFNAKLEYENVETLSNIETVICFQNKNEKYTFISESKETLASNTISYHYQEFSFDENENEYIQIIRNEENDEGTITPATQGNLLDVARPTIKNLYEQYISFESSFFNAVIEREKETNPPIYQYNKRQNLYNVIGSKNSDYFFAFTSRGLFSTMLYNKPLNDEKIILNNANFVCSCFSDIKSEEEVNN